MMKTSEKLGLAVLILAGAIPAAALSLFVDRFLGWLENRLVASAGRSEELG